MLPRELEALFVQPLPVLDGPEHAHRAVLGRFGQATDDHCYALLAAHTGLVADTDVEEVAVVVRIEKSGSRVETCEASLA